MRFTIYCARFVCSLNQCYLLRILGDQHNNTSLAPHVGPAMRNGRGRVGRGGAWDDWEMEDTGEGAKERETNWGMVRWKSAEEGLGSKKGAEKD